MTRTLEVGVRKAIGATRHQLSNQFLAEAIVVSLIAIVVGMGLAEVLLPTFNAVVYKQLEIEWLSVETGIGALTLALVVGVLSGFVSGPNRCAASSRPSTVPEDASAGSRLARSRSDCRAVCAVGRPRRCDDHYGATTRLYAD